VKYSESEMKRYHRQILRMYDEGFSVKKIAEQVGYSRWSLYGVFKRYGVKLQGRREPSSFKGKHHTEEAKLKNKLAHLGSVPANRFHTLNEDYFKEIDTKEKAYWLGFIAADGCVTNKRGWHFSWGLKDKEVLEQFLLDIQASHKVRSLKPGYFYISFANQRFIKNLTSHGIVPNKTFELKFPDSLDACLLPHFIRGYWDGDGYIGLSRNMKDLQISVVGTHDFISKLAQHLYESCNLRSNSFYHTKDHLCSFARTHRQAVKVCNYLYAEPVRFLRRKKEVYDYAISRRQCFSCAQ